MASGPRRHYIDGVLAATRLIWIFAVLGVVVPAAALGWLVTTFLFAFSGGQARMVPVVGYGAAAMIAVPLAAAAVAWRVRSPLAAFVAALAATGGGWIVTVLVEWLLSYRLGAA